MRLLLDTCVLYPTVMREMLIGAARRGYFIPLWSERILGEWERAARKLGAEGVLQAQSDIAMLRAAWPQAEVAAQPGLQARLWLPDENDTHVLAAAIAGSADAIVTVNVKDFPRHTLHEEGLKRIGPDELLYDLWQDDPEGMASVASVVLAEANRLSGRVWHVRELLKKARLPRIAKALTV